MADPRTERDGASRSTSSAAAPPQPATGGSEPGERKPGPAAGPAAPGEGKPRTADAGGRTAGPAAPVGEKPRTADAGGRTAGPAAPGGGKPSEDDARERTAGRSDDVPVLPDVTADERDVGWGDPYERDDDERLPREVPPHHGG